jgi:DivIVA domain-containing protein
LITLLAVLAVLAVVFGVAVVLTGRANVLSDEGHDRAETGIPRNRPMTPQDVIGLRFALAFRGYRMEEVDDALDRLAAEIAARDEAIERLRSGTPATEAAAEVEAEAAGPWAGAGPWAEPPAPAEAGTEPEQERPDVDAGAARAFEAMLAAQRPLAAPGAEPAAEAPAEQTVAWTPPPSPWTAPAAGDPAPAANPFRPEVPDIPAYDPWAVSPRSRYTDGPTYVEVEHADDEQQVADAVTEHQTGYALPPPATEPATDGATDDV